MKPASDPPTSLTSFLQAAPRGVAMAVSALSAAVSLTDAVALRLLEECGSLEMPPEAIVDCLHACDFVVERNSECHFEPSARAFLLNELNQHAGLAGIMHATLLQIAKEADPRQAGDTVPTYLISAVGEAYHTTPSQPEQGLNLYRKAYQAGAGQYTGNQWLVSVLAKEQYERKLLPAYAIEPYYYQGMIAYHEGHWQEAEENFSHIEQVIGDNESRIEAGTALHLLGKFWHHQGKDKQSLDVLNRSLSILQRCRDRRGEALVLNNIALVIGDRDRTESERLLRRSLNIGKELKDEQHQAQIENTLGNLLIQSNPKQAEEHLRRSLQIRERFNDERGQAQVLQSLAKLIKREDPNKAEEYLRKSLALDRKRGNLRGEALLLNSLASVIKHKNRDEAISMLRRSIEINEQRGDMEGKARSLNTLGGILSRSPTWKEAQQAFEEVLGISRTQMTLSIAKSGLAKIAQQRQEDRSTLRRPLFHSSKTEKNEGKAQRQKKRRKRKKTKPLANNSESEAKGQN